MGTKSYPELKDSMMVRILGFRPRCSGSDVPKMSDCGEGIGCGQNGRKHYDMGEE